MSEPLFEQMQRDERDAQMDIAREKRERFSDLPPLSPLALGAIQAAREIVTAEANEIHGDNLLAISREEWKAKLPFIEAFSSGLPVYEQVCSHGSFYWRSVERCRFLRPADRYALNPDAPHLTQPLS